MKTRIGFGLGTSTGVWREPDAFPALCTALERERFDSLWLSERVTGTAPDPIVAMSVAAGLTRKLKFGTAVLVVPGRNPVLLAKELASLDRLSGGRLLPAVGLGIADPGEQQAFNIERGDRAPWFDEALPLLRRLWEEDSVDHEGAYFRLQGITVEPKPVQRPLEMWLGGHAASELRRCGRLGDGWLPSFTTPAHAAEGRAVVEEAASEAGRTIDPEHYGALIVYTSGDVPPQLVEAFRRRFPDTDPLDVVASGMEALPGLISRFVDVGFSKFVVVPAIEPADWDDELARLAETVLHLQT